MVYYCAYTWNPGVSIEEVGPAILIPERLLA